MTARTDGWDEINSDGQPRRRTRRINVTDRDDCYMFIKEQAYFIRDISMAGVGLVMPAKDSLMLSKVLGDIVDCRIAVERKTLTGLQYRLVYLSPAPGDNMNCGLEWVNRDDTTLKKDFRQLIETLA